MTGARDHEAGYTLVELLVVLAIIGLLATAAMPLLPSTGPGLHARVAARELADTLVRARQQAIARNATIAVAFDPRAGRYGIRPGGDVLRLPQGVALAVRSPDADEIDFYADGSTSGGTVTLRAAKAKRIVRVRWPAGQVSIDE